MRPESGTYRSRLLIGLLLVCAVLMVYANAFQGAFQFDDYNVIVNNPRVHSWPAWLADFRHGIRPLLKLTYTFDWTMGLGASGFHLSNVFIHLCNTFLVFALSRRFVARQQKLKGKHTLPMLVALLFAVHPAHTEAVTYICGRSIALMTMFYLAGLLLYARGRMKNSNLYLHVLVPLCMVLALGVKETAVTFPAALLLWEITGGGSLKSAVLHQWSSWLLLLVSGVFFLMHAGYLMLLINSTGLNNVYGNAATQTLAIVYLLRQWLFPLWLNIDPQLYVLHDFSGLLPQIIVLGVIVLVMLRCRQRPWLSFALAWMLLQLFMLYLFLPRLDVANDRQLYLVSWPLALALVIEASLWLKPKTFYFVMMVWLIALASLTVMRNQDYYSEVALWEATAQQSPDKARVQNNLGYAYMQAGRSEEARTAFATSLSLDKNYYQAHYNLLRLNENEETESHK